MKVFSTSQSKITVSGEPLFLTQVVLDSTSKSSEVLTPAPYHEVNLIDRSGSIDRQINQVIDVLIERVRHLITIQGSKITIGWFSGEGQYSFLFKFSSPSEELISKLDSLRSTVGATCFSEILTNLANSLHNELDLSNYTTVVNLMTDGQPVVYDVNSEMRKSLEQAKIINEKAIFNAIGVGDYYNRKFLADLVSTGTYGKFVHIDEVQGLYSDTLIQNAGDSNNVIAAKATFFTDQDNCKLIYISDTKLNIANFNKEISFNKLSEQNVHTFYVVSLQKLKTISINCNDEDEVCEASLFTDITPVYKEQVGVALAYDFLLNNMKKISYDILKNNVKDKYLTTLVNNAFTYSEIGNALKELYEASVKNDLFKEGKCGPGFNPQSATISTLKVLALIANSDDSMFVMDGTGLVSASHIKARNEFIRSYSRVTRKTEDEGSVFSPNIYSGDDVIGASVNKLVFAEDRLNASLNVTIDGKVKLNPNSASRVGLPELYDAFIYRTFTFVKDGILNIKAAEFVVNKEVLTELESINAKYRGFIRSKFESTPELTAVIIDFTRIPLVISSVEDIPVDFWVDTTLKLNQLEVNQKAIKYVLADANDANRSTIKSGEFKKLTVDQIKVLADHGVKPDGAYQYIRTSAPTVDNLDTYSIREVVTAVKGFSALPSRKDVDAKIASKKPFTPSQQAMHEAITKYQDMVKDVKPKDAVVFLTTELANIRKSIMNTRAELANIKISTILNGGWFDEITLDEKDSAMLSEQVILKVKRAIEYV